MTANHKWRSTLLTVVEITSAITPADNAAVAVLKLPHDQRHIRRKVVRLSDHRQILFDLPEPTVLCQGDVLVLDDGSHVVVEATEEDLFVICAETPVHLMELAWHIGNRHLPAEIHPDSIRILEDRVILEMLEKLGAVVTRTTAPFVPVRGAYSGGGGHHHHHHDATRSQN